MDYLLNIFDKDQTPEDLEKGFKPYYKWITF